MNEEAAVRRTLHAYCSLLDERRLDDLATVYIEDAVDDRRRGTPLQGRVAIGQYFARALDAVSATAHLLTNVDVTIDGDTARAVSRVLALHWSLPAPPGGPQPADFVLVATYRDDLVRTPAGWRIARRTVDALGQDGLAFGVLPQVFAGFGGRSVTTAGGA